MKDFFKRALGGEESRARDDDDIRVAACALFLEMANIDDEFSEEERGYIMSILREEFGLSKELAAELTSEASAQLEGAVDLWRFTNLINEHYSKPEKVRVVELLWRIVYADGRLDAHEDYLMHKMGKLLRLQHKELIGAKLRVLRGGESQGS